MPRLLPFLIFFSVACAVVGGGHYYVWARLVRDTGLPLPAARVLTGLVVALGAGLPLALLLSRLYQGPGTKPALVLAFTWMGAGLLLVALLFGTDLLRWSLLGAARLTGAGPSAGLASPDRRLLFARLAAAVSGSGAAFLTAVSLREALDGLTVQRLEIRLPGLPAALDGLLVAQLSDVHIGPLLGRAWLAGVVEKVQALEPDLVVVTGDLVDGSVAQLAAHIEPLRALAGARLGCYFVTGNHEYYSGVDEWLAHLSGLGVRPLRNERIEVAPGLDLAGVDDWMAHAPGHGPDLRRALAGRDPTRPLILLAHQPRQFFAAAEAGVPLTLSGHTHGGQLWPFSWVVRLAQPFVAGLHRQAGSQLYVSRGTGFWGPPMRLGAPPEIALFRLRS